MKHPRENSKTRTAGKLGKNKQTKKTGVFRDRKSSARFLMCIGGVKRNKAGTVVCRQTICFRRERGILGCLVFLTRLLILMGLNYLNLDLYGHKSE